MGKLLSEKKAKVQYDGAPLICLGCMKLVLLIFFLKLMYFFPVFLNENALLFDKQNCFSFQI